MERRRFLKDSCNICLLGSAGFFFPQLTGCATTQGGYTAEIINKTINVPVVLFEKSTLQLVRPKGWYYDIAVQKKEDNTYAAMLLQCTHQENQLTRSGSGYTCSLHGSQFDLSGNVQKGPASKPLEKYNTSVSGDQLTIHL